MSTRSAAAQTSDDGGGDDQSGEALGFTPGADDDDSLLDAFEEAIELGDEDAEEFERPQSGRKGDKGKKGKKGKDAGSRRARNDADDEDGDGAEARGDDDDQDETDDDAEDDGEDQDGDDEDDENTRGKKAKGDGDESDDDEGDDPDEDYVEDDDGTKITVGELLKAHKFQREFATHRDQVLARVETEAKAKAETAQKDLDGRVKDIGDTLELLKALAPKLDDPPTTMLDKNHEDYDPDTYHTLVRMKQQVETVLEKARKTVADAKADADTKAKKQVEDYVKAEGAKLVKAFPEWGDPTKATKLEADLRKFLTTTYGMDDALINRLVDHRLFKVAFDAQKLHALKKKGAANTTRERKPARLVRSRERPTPTREGRQGGKGNRGALERLERTGKVRETDLEAVWGEFL